MLQIEMTVFRSVLANLPRMADSLEQIAKNTAPQPQIDFGVFDGGYKQYIEKNPDAYLSEDMFLFLSCVFSMFQQYGAKGVSKYILMHDRKNNIENGLDTNCQQITWSIDDFESHAEHLENIRYDGEQTYDREKFGYALTRMCDKHDASIGISWDTIGVYLDDYCLLGGE